MTTQPPLLEVPRDRRVDSDETLARELADLRKLRASGFLTLAKYHEKHRAATFDSVRRMEERYRQ